jgi:hypothetical protein
MLHTTSALDTIVSISSNTRYISIRLTKLTYIIMRLQTKIATAMKVAERLY